MTMGKIRGLFSAAWIALALIHSSACSDDPTARLRVIHLSQQLPIVDVGFDGERRARGLAYGEATDYLVSGVGTLFLRVVPNDGSSSLIEHELEVADGQWHTLYLLDRGNKVVLESSLDERSATGATRALRVVYSTAVGDPLRLSERGSSLIEAIEPNSVSSHVELAAGTLSLSLLSNLSDRVALALKELELPAGRNYTLAVYDASVEGSEALEARIFTDNVETAKPLLPELQDARVMFVHASAGADKIRASVAGEALSADPIGFLQNSEYQTVPSGQQTLELRVATGDTPIYSRDRSFRSANAYTVAIADEPTNLKTLVFLDDLLAPPANKVRLRLIHLSPDTSAVDLRVKDDVANLVSEVIYTRSSEFAPLAAGSHDLELRDNQSGTTLLALPSVLLEAGKNYTLLLHTSAAGLDAKLIENALEGAR